MATTTNIADNQLVTRGAVFALLAQLLGEDTTKLTDTETLPALHEMLHLLGEKECYGALERLASHEQPDQAELAGSWVRWFDHGRVSPYEASNVPVTAGGATPRLADIGGFYNAFGMSVTGERPDHIVAELEFMSLINLAQADATMRGDSEGGAVCANAARSFVRDHIGCWVDGWVARVGEVQELRPWWAVAMCTALFVRSEARRRKVVPLHAATMLAVGNEILEDDEADFGCSNECNAS